MKTKYYIIGAIILAAIVAVFAFNKCESPKAEDILPDEISYSSVKEEVMETVSPGKKESTQIKTEFNIWVDFDAVIKAVKIAADQRG